MSTLGTLLDKIKNSLEETQKAYERKLALHGDLMEDYYLQAESETLKNLIETSGIDYNLYEIYSQKPFKAKDQQRKEAVIKINNWMQKLHKQKPFLIIYGSYGTGKTHMALRILIKEIQKERPVYFTPKKDFDLKITNFQSQNTEEDLNSYIKKLQTVETLIIDDILAGDKTEYKINQLFTVLDYRYLRRMKTIITANEDPRKYEIDNSDWLRLKDRLIELGYFVPFKFISYRKLKQMQGVN